MPLRGSPWPDACAIEDVRGKPLAVTLVARLRVLGRPHRQSVSSAPPNNEYKPYLLLRTEARPATALTTSSCAPGA